MRYSGICRRETTSKSLALGGIAKTSSLTWAERVHGVLLVGLMKTTVQQLALPRRSLLLCDRATGRMVPTYAAYTELYEFASSLGFGHRRARTSTSHHRFMAAKNSKSS